MKTPVAFLIFNRPDTTEKVFEAIGQAKPPKLLVVADGARSDRPNEAEKCEAARKIIERVDWDCEVLKEYSNTNLGCGKRVASGLDWVFENVESAIILEDDCVPHPTFFPFCEELLLRYRDDKRIMSISALKVPERTRTRNQSYSYHFSRYHRCWGWATWKRAWEHFDYNMFLWSLIKEDNWLQDILDNKNYVRDWTNIFQSVYDNHIDTWAYRWMFACWLQSGLSILPSANLVTNIGFNAEATHTKNFNQKRANLQLEAMNFPLQHPPFIIQDKQADSLIQDKIHRRSNVQRIKSILKRNLNLK